MASSCDDSALPRVPISDRAAVSDAIRRHGFAILTNLVDGEETDGSKRRKIDWKEVALGLARRTFPAEQLRSDGATTLHSVHEENAKMGEQFRRRQAERKAKGECLTAAEWGDEFESCAGNPLLPHTDGYIYGDHLPDIIFLLCEATAERGGENFLIDGESVIKRLRAAADGPGVVDMAHSARVDLTERLSAGGMTTGREAFGPVFQRRDGVLWWRRMLRSDAYETGIQRNAEGQPTTVRMELQPYQSLWTPAPEEAEGDAHPSSREAIRDMLTKVDAALQEETRQAPRFILRPGEALAVDNFRMLHGREGYSSKEMDDERKMWRIWCWTTRSLGLPEGQIAFGSPLDADQLREKQEGV